MPPMAVEIFSCAKIIHFLQTTEKQQANNDIEHSNKY